MTVLVFKDETTYNTVCKELAVTPMGEGFGSPVLLWYDFEAEQNIITPLIGADGRRAVAHPFGEIERDWLESYCAGITGVQVLDELPSDWVYPVIN